MLVAAGVTSVYLVTMVTHAVPHAAVIQMVQQRKSVIKTQLSVSVGSVLPGLINAIPCFVDELEFGHWLSYWLMLFQD